MRRPSPMYVAILASFSVSLILLDLRSAASAFGPGPQTVQVLRVVPQDAASAHGRPAQPSITAPAAHAARAPARVVPRVRHRAWPTPAELMQWAIWRIPGFRPRAARWVMTAAYGHWGATDLDRLIVYISPNVPPSKMYDVVAHEWSHVLTVLDYDRDVPAALAALQRVFGGSGLLPAERAADCMARLLGAQWTGYTNCTRSDWRAAARRLLAGQRV